MQSKKILWFLFIVCLLVLSKYILFKKSPGYYKAYFSHHHNQQVIKEGLKQANFRPFATISLFSSARLRTEYKIENIGGNIIGFIPLGILLPLLFTRNLRNGWRVAAMVFLISLSFETIQLLTGLGSFDVDDLILNTTGGIIGYIFYVITKKILNPEAIAFNLPPKN